MSTNHPSPPESPSGSSGATTFTPLNLDLMYMKYEVGDVIGTGAFSEVRRATERSSRTQYAIKIIDKAKCKGKESMIQSEVAILRRVKHRNIIRLFEMFESPQKIFLVMEIVTGGELFDRIVEKGRYAEPEAAKLIYEILMGVDYLHSKGICHRDLKPENLLFYDKSPKARIMISDFGLSKIFDDMEVMKTACGTPGYVAPEVLRRQGYTKHVDMWSVGVIAYILLSGYPPFYEENNHALFQQILKGNYSFDSPYWDKISNVAKHFISKILIVDPKKRLTTSEALVHPFLLKHCPEARNNALVLQQVGIGEVLSSSPQLIPPKPCFLPSPTSMECPGSSYAASVSSAHSTTSTSSNGNSATSASSITTIKSYIKSAFKNISQRKLVEKDKNASVSKPNEPPVFIEPTAEKKPFEFTPFIQTTVQVKPNVAKSAELLPTIQCTPYAMETAPCGVPLVPKDQKTNSVDDSGTVATNSTQYLAHPLTTKHPSVLHPHHYHYYHHHHHHQLPYPPSGLPTSSLIPNPTQHPNLTSSFNPTPLPLPSSSFSISCYQTIRLLSYSIFMKAPGLKNSFSEYKNARLNFFIQNVLPAYGIVCLQEMYAYGSNRVSRFLQLAKDLNFHYSVVSPAKGLLNGCMDAGLLILSRYPIVHQAHLTFRRALYGCRFIAKGALYARIALGPHPGQCLHVFNTHLQKAHPNASPDQRYHEWQVRQDQLLQLRAFILEQTAHKHPSEPILLVGDFHLNANATTPGDMHSDEYNGFLQLLSEGDRSTVLMLWLDLLLRKYGQHPITYGDMDMVSKMPTETLFTEKQDQGSCRATDYALWSPGPTSSNDPHAITVDLNQVKIETFKVPGQPFTHLSDHYAIQVALKVPTKNNECSQ